MNQRITDIVITPINPSGELIGFASFVLDGDFKISSVAIHKTPDGYRLSYPKRVAKNRREFDCCHPMTEELEKEIEANIFFELSNN